MMKKFIPLFLFIVIGLATPTFSQQSLVQDYAQSMSIPAIKTMGASSSHLYVLSQQEGLAVFRIKPSGLQWLYTSSGMQRRGNTISADARFAYLYGDSRRLTVIEPTSVLGVYSSTLLPAQPSKAVRLHNYLYVAMNEAGLGQLSLESPETVDSPPTIITEGLNDVAVLDIAAAPLTNQLFVLTNNNKLVIFTSDGSDSLLTLSKNVSLNERLNRLFIDEDKLWGSTTNGDVFEITANGIGKKLGSTSEPVLNILQWNNFTMVRTQSGKLWYSENRNALKIWKSDSVSGNLIAHSGNQLWIAENDKIANVATSTVTTNDAEQVTGPFKIKDIPNQILTYPNALLLPLELDNGHSPKNVEFSIRSNAQNVSVKKQGFYWQPSPSQIGMNWFTVLATNTAGDVDSTRFTVDVRSFNTPPRFSPVRTNAIAINEDYELQIQAIDPEEPSNSLIRYLGVDLPEGAKLNEETGMFSWKPSAKQVGEFTFRVIATDQLGAASSQDITLTVLDITRGGN